MARSETNGPVDGTATLWHDDKGWGAVASPAVEGEVWTHFSNIEMDGFHRLDVGEPVRFTYETPGQDGYPHRAITVRRLAP
jgi:CspA family cold shock protein